MACNIFHGVVPRLARWLLETRDRAASNGFPLTQDHMAVMLGVQRTTINAAAQRLKAAGAILYSRGVVRITDRHRLEEMTCECYRPPLNLLTAPPEVTSRRRVA